VYASYIDENRELGNNAICAMTYELKRSCDSFRLTVQHIITWVISKERGASSITTTGAPISSTAADTMSKGRYCGMIKRAVKRRPDVLDGTPELKILDFEQTKPVCDICHLILSVVLAGDGPTESTQDRARIYDKKTSASLTLFLNDNPQIPSGKRNPPTTLPRGLYF
jgi:hypothetical protein